MSSQDVRGGRAVVGSPASLPGQLQLAPVHRDDPASSHEAAERVRPKVGSQLQQVLTAVLLAGPSGASNREIQIKVCGGYNPGHPAWNKIPTRCRTLERRGLLELVLDDGEPLLLEHETGGRFMVWRLA
jgi:hypothetical protein